MCREDSASRVLQYQDERLNLLTKGNLADMKVLCTFLKNPILNTSRRQLRFSRNLQMNFLREKMLFVQEARTSACWDDKSTISHYVIVGDTNIPTLKLPNGSDVEFLQAVKSNFEVLNTVYFHWKFCWCESVDFVCLFREEAVNILNYTLRKFEHHVFGHGFIHLALMWCLKSYRTVFEFFEPPHSKMINLQSFDSIGYTIPEVFKQLNVSYVHRPSCDFELIQRNEILFELLAVVKYFTCLSSYTSSRSSASWENFHRLFDCDDDIMIKGTNVYIEETASLVLLKSMLLHMSRGLDVACVLAGEDGKIGFFVSNIEVKSSMKRNFVHIMNFTNHTISNGIIHALQLDVLDALLLRSALAWSDSEVQALFIKALVTYFFCFTRTNFENGERTLEVEKKFTNLIEKSVIYICNSLRHQFQIPLVAHFGLLFFRLYTQYFCDHLELDEFISKEFMEIDEDGVKLAVDDSDDEDEESNENCTNILEGKCAFIPQCSSHVEYKCYASDQGMAVTEMIKWKSRVENELLYRDFASKEYDREMNSFPDVIKCIALSNTAFNQVTEQVLLFMYQVTNRSTIGKLAMIETGIIKYVNDVKLSSRRKIGNLESPFEQYIIALCEIIEQDLLSDI